ncbi:conserved hypothetical protein [Candidatus Desulfosporosinus infrequens]|uniref:DUF6431 domain-containing protein n=1 Tax=Candidatus Desulfosporosinus infrequens TaxID=2043169 RepID=A0A2U3LCA9_9FIRM|nr:conserved hypothetical protein [Candidatus Desulfosporosinus infrequens]
MQLIIPFSLTPLEYIDQFQFLDIQRPDSCPNCQVPHSFHKHGIYWRNIINVDYEGRLPVARFCCKVCRMTISILPAFVLPYFQYSLRYIIVALQTIFLVCQTQLTALFRFYRKRLKRNLIRIEMFFRDQNWQEISPHEEKEKAKKIVCMLTVPTAETFSQKFHQQYKLNFMAS